MSTRVVERIDDWDEQSFSGGYSGLHDLADREFSGVVRAEGAELFMTKGVVVGVRRGSIEDFEDSAGTVYAAPTPALPLLAIMQERSEEVRAKYYTEKTSISEVDQTLEDGGFTGFIELSENVLSGDYYLVYHRGRSMSVAYVGSAQRLIEGDEAFEQADDEVGIYKVRPADIDAIEIPEPTTTSTGSAGAGAVGDAGGEPKTDEIDPVSAAEPEEDEPADEPTSPDNEPGGEAPEGGASETGTASQSPQPDQSPPETTASTDTSSTQETANESTERASPPVEEREQPDESKREPEPSGDPGHAETTQSAGSHEQQRRDAEPTGVSQQETPTTNATQQDESVETQQTRDQPVQQSPAASQSTTGATGGETQTGRQSTPESPSDLETRTIPSLDPELTESNNHANNVETTRGDAQSESSGQHATETVQTETTESQTQSTASTAPEPQETATEETAPPQEPAGTTANDEQLEEKEATIRQLQSEIEEAKKARDEARADLATVQEERDELEREVERLQKELARLEDELGAKMNAERRITPQEALEGTDIFVRYHSKGAGTLKKAHDSGRPREDVTENLRLEKHTQFDAGSVAVGGQAYDEFLEGRIEYNFIGWVVTNLLFEIQETGNTETLRDLYDALPKINRIELNGVVTTTDEDDNEVPESFDIVFRERMGDPLLVANINESRQGATESMMGSLITAAERVGKASEEFAAAFLVTESFFEPEALETVATATRGGLLTRDKRKSFANLTRKHGYHLCLVEARNENFHLEVPEL